MPFLGICLGMQMACVEFARNVAQLEDANSKEINPETPHNIIDLMIDQVDVENMGGTLRLGAYPCQLQEGSKTKELYDNEGLISERHRHRYEFNNEYRKQFEELGMVFSGVSPDNRLVEIVELPENDFFVASQFHPEFKSRPNRSHPLFNGLIKASLNN